MPRNFTIYLLSGLVPWFAFQLCMSKAATVIPANAAFVKQVVFDLNVLPIATALLALLAARRSDSGSRRLHARRTMARCR